MRLAASRHERRDLPLPAGDGGGRWLEGVALPALLGLAVLAFYVVLYPIRHYRVGIGSDTPVYVWWTRYAGALGLGGFKTGTRPAVVGTLATLARTTGRSAADVAGAIGPVLAAALALAAGGFVEASFGRARLRFALVVLLTGSFLSLMVPGYVATLAFGALFVAALAVLADGLPEPGWVAAVAPAALLGAAGLSHPQFLLLALAVVAGAGLAVARGGARGGLGEAATVRRALGRLLAASLGGAGLAGAGLVASAGPAPGGRVLDTSRDALLRRTGLGDLLRASYRRKLIHDFPWYRPLAWIGLAVLPLERRGDVVGPPDLAESKGAGRLRKRFFRGALLAWLVVTAGGVVLLLAGTSAPGQRLAAVAVPVPILAALGLYRVGWPGSQARDGLRRKALAGGGVVLFMGVGWLSWQAQKPLATADAVREARAVGAIMARTPAGTPSILVVDDNGERPSVFVTRYANYLLDGVPPARIEDVYVFVGTAADLLRGRPTLTGDREHDALARTYWEDVRRVLPRAPTAYVIRDFGPARYNDTLRLPGTGPVAPGVAEVGLHTVPATVTGRSHGPPFREPGAGPQSPWLPVWLAPLLLVILAVVGWPWGMAALPGRPRLTRAALAPAFGLGAVGLASIAVDATGLRLAASGGPVALGVALAGGVAAARLRTRRGAPASD